MTKKLIVSITAICVIAAAIISSGAYWYLSCYPSFAIKRMVSENGDDYHSEWLMMVIADNPNIPIAESVQEKIREYSDWNNNVVEELKKYSAPLDIRVSGDVKDGKTTFRYTGYVTTQDGETIAYQNEKVIDYIFVKGDKLFDISKIN